MIPLSLRQIATVTGGRVHPENAAEVLIEGTVVTDSREAGPGSLYVARRGEHADGHAFVGAAADNGAVAALVDHLPEGAGVPCVVVSDTQEGFGQLAREVVGRCQESGGLEIIGITGSSGKTSTKDLMAQVLGRLGETVAPIASYNSEVGVPLTVCRLTPDTRYLVAEMGASGVGHIAYLTTIAPPRIGVVLNVGSAHLGEFGSREAIAHTKAELVRPLPEDGVAVLNADDAVVAAMAAQTRARVLTVGRSADADARATDVRLDERGRARFTMTLPSHEQPLPVALRLHGEHQVGNALAVAVVAAELGMAPADIATALGEADPVSRWRMEVHELPGGVTLVNDAYNANPESMAAALRSLAAMSGGGRTIAVLGEMRELGAESVQEHLRIGELAADLGIDVLVAVGPGAAPVGDGYAAATGGDPGRRQVHRPADRHEARALLGDLLTAGDVALLKSSRDSGLRLLGDEMVQGSQGAEAPQRGRV
ncbi:UDP-N-acetylmuramoyl-tripeptide--D-alanyl-D-alanine ligase [Ornithinicoccus halotolerans]|uniref:UDP-N-acetylmuramoyl-tripeptide--D-alanyl-D- alanine ligase n=1 Tax=Ornithinicoccus halotolerans TaxID=1748220 RepID=UPI0012979162|nr:UDP-N-acetylmuramoyl-tripeptide--D-alanyl-D-alanine ligase [Ornithinicoccus halotolerans]